MPVAEKKRSQKTIKNQTIKDMQTLGTYKKEYDKMLEYIEELEDAAAYDIAKAEKGKNIPWEKVKR